MTLEQWDELRRGATRLPFILKTKARSGTIEEDYEFEELKLAFDDLHQTVSKMLAMSIRHNDAFVGMLEHSRAIGASMNVIFGNQMSGNQSQEIYNQYSIVRKKVDVYLSVIDELTPEVRSEMEVLVDRIDTPLKSLLDRFKSVEKYMKRRGNALVDYRMYQDSFERLLAQKEPTVKAKQKEMDLRVKIDDAQKVFDSYNYSIKKELPVFLLIAKQCLTQIFTMIYYANAYLYFQLNESMLSIGGAFGFAHTNPRLADIVEEFHISHDPIANASDSIGICHFHEFMLSKISMDVVDISSAGASEICTAKFKFTAVEESDLNLEVGDKVKVTSKGKGWWKGVNLSTGLEGLFPVNYTDARA